MSLRNDWEYLVCLPLPFSKDFLENTIDYFRRPLWRYICWRRAAIVIYLWWKDNFLFSEDCSYSSILSKRNRFWHDVLVHLCPCVVARVKEFRYFSSKTLILWLLCWIDPNVELLDGTCKSRRLAIYTKRVWFAVHWSGESFLLRVSVSIHEGTRRGENFSNFQQFLRSIRSCSVQI